MAACSLLIAAKIAAAVSLGWAVIALAFQVWAARGGGRTEYSVRAGSPLGGLIYNFTTAMLPAHKESVRRHPGKFAVGLAMHSGLLLALAGVILLLVAPAAGYRVLELIRWPLLVSLIAGFYLFVRRLFDADLEAMSAPDDFLAILSTCAFLALVVFLPASETGRTILFSYTAMLFLYLPLGKLRHIVFFFIARGDFGRRLGYRGVYPPARATME